VVEAVGQWRESWIDGTTSPDVQTRTKGLELGNAVGRCERRPIADAMSDDVVVVVSVESMAVLVQE
jgi:hypothetical protein